MIGRDTVDLALNKMPRNKVTNKKHDLRNYYGNLSIRKVLPTMTAKWK